LQMASQIRSGNGRRSDPVQISPASEGALCADVVRLSSWVTVRPAGLEKRLMYRSVQSVARDGTFTPRAT